MNYRSQNFAVICRLLGGTGLAHEAVMRGTVFVSFLLTSAFYVSAHTPQSEILQIRSSWHQDGTVRAGVSGGQVKGTTSDVPSFILVSLSLNHKRGSSVSASPKWPARLPWDGEPSSPGNAGRLGCHPWLMESRGTERKCGRGFQQSHST